MVLRYNLSVFGHGGCCKNPRCTQISLAWLLLESGSGAKTRYHVFDRAKILKALSSPYVANITADSLEWPGDIQILN
jgi:hypothetical protein